MVTSETVKFVYIRISRAAIKQFDVKCKYGVHDCSELGGWGKQLVQS